MKNEVPRRHRGETIVSLLVAIAIFGALLVAITAFQINIFKFSKISEARSQVDQRYAILLRNFAKELRTAQGSSTGSYALAKTDPTELIFYSDLKNDGLVDRIRYSVKNQALERGITTPSGNPLSYNTQNEAVTVLLPNIVGSDPAFTYYDGGYNGTTNITPLLQPVNIQQIQFVLMHLTVDTTNPALSFISVTTTVTIRNLKDN